MKYITFLLVKDEMDYDTILTKFEDYSIPRKKLTQVRYKFLFSRQDEAEKFVDFINKKNVESRV